MHAFDRQTDRQTDRRTTETFVVLFPVFLWELNRG